jgi:hypothetical protein
VTLAFAPSGCFDGVAIGERDVAPGGGCGVRICDVGGRNVGVRGAFCCANGPEKGFGDDFGIAPIGGP